MEFKEVHSDERRTIFANSELLGDKEFTFIKLNKGKAIGGCMHTKDEYFMIVDGNVRVKIGTIDEYIETGQGGTIISGEPHMFEALKDSIICEWGISAKDKLNQQKDLNMLKEILYINNGIKKIKEINNLNDKSFT